MPAVFYQVEEKNVHAVDVRTKLVLLATFRTSRDVRDKGSRKNNSVNTVTVCLLGHSGEISLSIPCRDEFAGVTHTHKHTLHKHISPEKARVGSSQLIWQQSGSPYVMYFRQTLRPLILLKSHFPLGFITTRRSL